MFTDPRVQIGRCDLRLAARQPARRRVDHLEACRLVIASSHSVELGVEPRWVDERDTPCTEETQPLHGGFARCHHRDPPGAPLEAGAYLLFALPSSHVS